MRLPQFPATMPAIEHCITGGGRFSLGSFYLPYHGVGGVKFFFRYKGFVRIFGDDPFFRGGPGAGFCRAYTGSLVCDWSSPRYIYRFLRCSAQ